MIESMEAARGRRPGEPYHSDGEVGQLLARRDHDCFDRLPAMAMPVLIAAGRHGGHAFFVEDRSAYPAMERFLLTDD